MSASKQRPCRARRGFLLSIGLGAAGAATVSGKAVAERLGKTAPEKPRGYALTPHIRNYYRTTKL
ncbi:MAG TPA: formate dehydrogenase [Burkholderiales bacterium]|nr:formate dehydrogenase [Burkholderiales bacterium]